MKKLKVKLNIDLGGYKCGNILSITCDDSGVPVDQFWRNRVRDSKIDECLEVINEKTVDQKSVKKD